MRSNSKMPTAVEFKSVSKRFRLFTERSHSIKELLIKLKKFSYSQFWALKDVSFDVKKGETLGIVGENGSGKSTALKLLSGIYRPTEGTISHTGKISGLIELGAGFHPELTGRENIYLNGAILGLSRKEVNKKLDDIVAFSELEKFIDNPVKNYSSGMHVRLGFSVAIHVNPDILLIDEVLAVGDEHFQRKCFDKIIEFKRGGKTIIIVSHALEELRNLCDTAVWLHEGELKEAGKSSKVIDSYLKEVNRQESLTEDGRAASIEGYGQRWGSREAEITKVELLDAFGKKKRTFKTNDRLVARIHYNAHKVIEAPVFGVAVHRIDGTHVTGPNTKVADVNIPKIEGKGCIEYRINSLPLLKGDYLFSAAIYDNTCKHAYDHHDEMYMFKIEPGAVKESFGVIHFPAEWKVSK